MPDIIKLLPDAVANQIAAGEVIQRPASALKELLENSIDAGAANIKVIIKDAGKTLLQVVDNGCGMSSRDARMSFERHATSKISKAEDLFAIRTKGFRGEALASIAAIAQVELKTKRQEDETGTCIVIEGADLKSEESCACTDGTSFMMKNLFYNVPARRNFLKSNAAETRHIIDEFQRVALIHPEISFSLFHDGNEVFNLKESNLRQRIVNIFGSNYNERLVPVDEETTIMKITGYIGKPEFAKKTRGEQYFFVNRRFVKDGYLNHAVTGAFEEMLPKDSFPSYFLDIEIDPSKIDINIHPTKTEIKFEDERSVYAIMKAAVKMALGKFSITPTLDFEQEPSFTIPLSKLGEIPKPPSITVNKNYNPFKTESIPVTKFPGEKSFKHQGTGNWNELYKGMEEVTLMQIETAAKINYEHLPADAINELHEHCFRQLHHKYITVVQPHEILVIDQQAAHEKVIYDKYAAATKLKPMHSQQNLFPHAIEFTMADFVLLKEIEPEIKLMGFDLHEFGKNTFVVHGIPAGIDAGQEKRILEEIIEQFKNNSSDFRNNKTENIIRTLSRTLAVKAGQLLTSHEMKQLATDLFRCPHPEHSATGKKIFIRLGAEQIEKFFV